MSDAYGVCGSLSQKFFLVLCVCVCVCVCARVHIITHAYRVEYTIVMREFCNAGGLQT